MYFSNDCAVAPLCLCATGAALFVYVRSDVVPLAPVGAHGGRACCRVLLHRASAVRAVTGIPV